MAVNPGVLEVHPGSTILEDYYLELVVPAIRAGTKLLPKKHNTRDNRVAVTIKLLLCNEFDSDWIRL